MAHRTRPSDMWRELALIPLFRPEQVQAMDRRAFERGITSASLMERAAGHLARGIVHAGGHGYGLRAGILCGKGNNGGDGIAAARRLLAAGAAPRVYLVGGEDGLSEDAALQLRRWRAVGGRVVASLDEALHEVDVTVDCLLGTGASGEPRPPYDDAVRALNQMSEEHGTRVVACDLPTGVDADTGGVPGLATRADLTVTLGAHKRGLWLWPARGYTGTLALGELGIVDAGDEPAAHMLEEVDVGRLVPPPARDGHKRSQGVVVILAGSPGMSGAATLVARGAMAAGAGLVTVATAAGARHMVAPTVPEALTVELPDNDPDAAFEQLASQLGGAQALAVGPGLGHSDPEVRLVRRIVAEVDIPLVLDADGINAFRHEGGALAEHASPLLTLTPHAREFGRLFEGGGDGPGEEPNWVQRATVVPDCAAKWGAAIVAKGPGSMTAAPDGRVWVNPTGSGALATGGSGDVLTGMTATLVAQRPEPESVAAAVYLHGLAGEIAEEQYTARPVTALDVARALPQAFRRIDAARS